MTSLARGLAVMRCFADAGAPMSIAQAARLTGLSRPAVKRCLHTLVRLGYAAQDGTHYELRPKTLALGYAYLSSSSLAIRAQPLLDRLRDEIHESCSLGVVEEDEVYYVARAEVSRIMSIALRAGSRLPLYCTSMGRVLLAGWDRADQEAYLRRTKLVAPTPKTRTDPAGLLALFQSVREEGCAVVDEELEVGLRSVAVPVFAAGKVVAAVNVGVQASRVTTAELRSRFLPPLRKVAAEIGMLGMDRRARW
ncbi:IclR family transcriptional regulator domain-containing protein [Novosphingobium naphthalenivorans]|uniref:IclR family transcriptional regulator domain-containing protein n=1 Tax=Novosphingobium naphthalenivorans TaxID=273168 RepID=UPI001FDF1DBD|nr:IclR family transcriptional regulator C-terminal domain-containing protein [Novosphingobium naphthalenivorans]